MFALLYLNVREYMSIHLTVGWLVGWLVSGDGFSLSSPA